MAADFPEHELRLIVPTGTGGSIDRMARSVQRFLPDILGVQVLVENRKGAGGTIAIKHFLKQPADGHTILVTLQPAMTIIKRKAPELVNFDDMSVININWIDPAMIVVSKNPGWNSLDDMVEAIRKEPGKYSYAIPGRYSAANFAGQILLAKLGLNVRQVPYSGGGDSRIALRGGHVDITVGGAVGNKTIEDVAVPLGVFWQNPVNEWPDVRPINEDLKKYSVTLPEIGSIRYFALHSKVKEKFPERYQKLINAFQKLVTEHEGFKKFCDETKIGREWYGPEKSHELIMNSHEIFSEIKLPRKKK